jgi:hypothetical protein
MIWPGFQEKEYYSSSGPIGRIVSNGARPVYSPVIVHSPIEQRVEAVYLLAAIVSSGCPHVGLYIARFRVWCEQYVLCHRLIEVEILIQIEVSDRCSDVQTLFSVIGTDGGNIYVQKKLRSAQKNPTK